MADISMTGNDTITFNNRVINDLGDGDCVMLSFPNEIAQVKVGKNGNAIFALNQMGQVADVKMRVLRGSADDSYLNNLIVQQNANFAGTVLNFGEFIKKVGDGSGNITNDTYIMGSGVMAKNIEGKSNQEGDTAQSICEYNVRFAKAIRVLT